MYEKEHTLLCFYCESVLALRHDDDKLRMARELFEKQAISPPGVSRDSKNFLDDAVKMLESGIADLRTANGAVNLSGLYVFAQKLIVDDKPAYNNLGYALRGALKQRLAGRHRLFQRRGLAGKPRFSPQQFQQEISEMNDLGELVYK